MPDTLRPARPEDAAAVTELVQRAYAAWVPLLGRRPLPMDDDYAARIAAGQALLLERDGALLGLLILEDRPGYLWLDNISVDPARQGEGIGRALMAVVEAEARRRGHPEVRLLTNARMERNRRLYRALGYRETGETGPPDFRRVDMAKMLGPPGPA
jgi:GNAT superfamily N-acetyltransferase